MNLRWQIAQQLELYWWRGYLARKLAAPYLKAKKAYWQALLDRAGVCPLPGSRVLDAGCGPAGIFMVLEAQQVTALDPLWPAYQRLLNTVDPEAYPWVTFRAEPLETFHDPAGYDLVCCMNAINHVQDWAMSLRRLLAVTRPGGRLLLSVDVHRSHRWKWVLRFTQADLLHPHQHGLEEYASFLGEIGFKELSFWLIKSGRIFDHILLSATKNK